MATGSKGYDLEETLKAYFTKAGYFVVRGLPYRVGGDEITDVDLWLYERPAALTRRRLIVDAKNKKIPRAAERIVWAKGLQAALGADGAIVASTDTRAASRLLARGLGITLLDGEAVGKLKQSTSLQAPDALPSDQLDALVKEVDAGRRSSEWRSALLSLRASLLTAFGVHSANTALTTIAFFAEQTVAAAPRSVQASVGLRCVYYASALAAISLDFVLADQVFRSQDDRRSAILNAVRYGGFEAPAALSTVRAAIGLVRQHAENGAAVAKQVERGFNSQAEQVPAEIIADFVSRLPAAETLFNVARELEGASNRRQLPSFDQVSVEARSAMGAFLDFAGVTRQSLALAWPSGAASSTTPAPAPDEPNLL